VQEGNEARAEDRERHVRHMHATAGARRANAFLHVWQRTQRSLCLFLFVCVCRVAAHRAINDAKRPDLISRFTKSCGFGMGLEFREGAYVINDKNQKTMAKGEKKGTQCASGLK